MPELPEVETIKRQLSREIIGKKIAGNRVIRVRRRAKILIIDFADGSSLAFHLKLTGQLIFNGKRSKHTRHIFKFDDGSNLIFNDMRKFGWWKKLASTKKLEQGFGPEALSVGLADFKEILSKRPRAKIKALLMDQKAVAGIGNIYSDEILFLSKIQPLRLIGSLQNKEMALIWSNIGKVLKRAIILRGTSERSYVDAHGEKGGYLKELKVYRRENKNCFHCGALIKRKKLGSRSAHFCPNCQR